MGLFAFAFIIDVVFTSICIFIATKLAFVSAEFKQLVPIIFVVSVVSLVPSIGWVLGLITFVYLLMKVTDADLMSSIWVVIFSKLVAILAALTLIS